MLWRLNLILVSSLLTMTVGTTGSSPVAETGYGVGTVSAGKSHPYQPIGFGEQNTTSIGKTNPYWPVKRAITVEPCSYSFCMDV